MSDVFGNEELNSKKLSDAFGNEEHHRKKEFSIFEGEETHGRYESPIGGNLKWMWKGLQDLSGF